jgi:hypothetical protein
VVRFLRWLEEYWLAVADACMHLDKTSLKRSRFVIELVSVVYELGIEK